MTGPRMGASLRPLLSPWFLQIYPPSPVTSSARISNLVKYVVAITTSILIPSFNTRELSIQCIRSIERDPPTSYEIILMDNNSSDGTYEEVTHRFPRVRV